MDSQYVAAAIALTLVGFLTCVVAGLLGMIITRADAKNDAPFIVALIGGVFGSAGLAFLVGYYIYLWALKILTG